VCGLSLFIEKERRRKELALFVLPRAIQARRRSLRLSGASPTLSIPFASSERALTGSAQIFAARLGITLSRWAAVALFSASLTALLHAVEHSSSKAGSDVAFLRKIFM
jgi:hypothetical protein